MPLEGRCAFWVSGLDAMPWAKRSDACNNTPDDDTVRSGAVSGPALINLADSNGRCVSAIGEIGNLRDHIETVDLGLIIDGKPGCTEDIQPILPGHNPFSLMESERKRVGSPPPRRARPDCSAQRLTRRAPYGGCKRPGRIREGNRNRKASLSVIYYENGGSRKLLPPRWPPEDEISG